MAYLSIEIAGLKELVNSLDPKQFNKGIAIGIGRAAETLHLELEAAIKRRYNTPRDLSSVRAGKSTSTAKIGQNFVEAGLQYRFKAEDMSKYPYIYYMGNINPASKPGPVHEVEIVKGRRKIVKGKEHRGGFVPRKKGQRATSFGRFGAQMFERKSNRKLPLRVLYGPPLVHLAANVYEHDEKLQTIKDKIVQTLADTLPL